jgi:hypothetical protein
MSSGWLGPRDCLDVSGKGQIVCLCQELRVTDRAACDLVNVLTTILLDMYTTEKKLIKRWAKLESPPVSIVGTNWQSYLQ